MLYWLPSIPWRVKLPVVMGLLFNLLEHPLLSLNEWREYKLLKIKHTTISSTHAHVFEEVAFNGTDKHEGKTILPV